MGLTPSPQIKLLDLRAHIGNGRLFPCVGCIFIEKWHWHEDLALILLSNPFDGLIRLTSRCIAVQALDDLSACAPQWGSSSFWKKTLYCRFLGTSSILPFFTLRIYSRANMFLLSEHALQNRLDKPENNTFVISRWNWCLWNHNNDALRLSARLFLTGTLQKLHNSVPDQWGSSTNVRSSKQKLCCAWVSLSGG